MNFKKIYMGLIATTFVGSMLFIAPPTVTVDANTQKNLSSFPTSNVVGEYLGLQHVNFGLQDDVDIFTEAGYNAARIEANWHEIETDFDVYNWSFFDSQISGASSVADHVVALIGYGNGLYTPAGVHNYCFSFDLSTEPEMDAYVEFAQEVITRHQGKNIIWEFVNEPDLFVYKNNYDPDLCREEDPNNTLTAQEKGEKYALLLEKVADTLRPLFPNEVFITGGLAYAGSGNAISNAFMETAVLTDTLDAFDGFGFHEYQVAMEKPGDSWKMGQMKSRLQSKYPNAVYLNTESGGSGGDNFTNNAWWDDTLWEGFDSDKSLTDMQQAAYLPRTYLYGLDNSSTMYMQHKLFDFNTPNPREALFGIRDINGNKKPSFYSTKALTDILGGFTFTNNLSTSYGAPAWRVEDIQLEYEKNGQRAYAFWAAQDPCTSFLTSSSYTPATYADLCGTRQGVPHTRDVTFTLDNGVYQVFDMLGNQLDLEVVTNGQVTIQNLNEYPQYWVKDQQPAVFPGDLPAYPVFSDPNWSVVNQGDFDGDGNQDIVWRSISGDVSIWLLDGNGNFKSGNDLSNVQVTDAQSFGAVDPAFKIAAIGDMNGDGYDDIVWQHDTIDSVAFWYLAENLSSGVSFVSGVVDPALAQVGIDYNYLQVAVAPDWRIRGVADIDGDGYGDLVWRSNISGLVSIWEMAGQTTYTEGYYAPHTSDPTWKIIGAREIAPGMITFMWQNSVTNSKAEWLIREFDPSTMLFNTTTFASGTTDPGSAQVNIDYYVY